MEIEQQLAAGVAAAVKALYAVEIAEKQIQVSPTRKEFEGHLTVMVFPFMKQTGKKNPEELGREIGEWLAETKNVDAVSFTGSTAVGSSLLAGGAKEIRRTFLELGGKLPTGIESLPADHSDRRLPSQANDVIYNLAGQRLAQPQRGINIVNGKRLLIK